MIPAFGTPAALSAFQLLKVLMQVPRLVRDGTAFLCIARWRTPCEWSFEFRCRSGWSSLSHARSVFDLVIARNPERLHNGHHESSPRLRTVLESGSLKNKGRRVSNPAQWTRAFRHIVRALATDPAFRSRPASAAGRVPRRCAGQPDRDRDTRSDPGRPCYSLPETREPTAEMLRGVDALVIDLPCWVADLHVHVHDGELPSRGQKAWCSGDRHRSAEPNRRREDRRASAGQRI